MIVLDTNQLKAAAFPHGAVLGMLRKIADIHQRTLAIPEMVAVEHEAHYFHGIEETLTAARKNFTTLGKAFDQDLLSHISNLSPEHASQARRTASENVFRILPTPKGAAEESLRREANRLPPAEQVWEAGGREVKARGARDVAIWLTLLDAAGSVESEVWFVSLDADFGSMDDLHPALRQEADEKLGEGSRRLRLLHGGIDQLLRELATPAQKPENLQELLEGPVVTYAVNIALGGGELFFRLMSFLPAGDRTWYEATGISLNDVHVRRASTYRVGDRTWVSAQLKLRAAKSYHARVNGTFRTDVIDLAFEATVLLELEGSGVRSAEVVASGPLTVLDTSSVEQVSDVPPWGDEFLGDIFTVSSSQGAPQVAPGA